MQRTFPYQVTDNLYVLGNELLVSYLLRGQSCTLMEMGGSGSVPLVEKQLRTLGIANDQVEHLVVQHAHWDHACGLPYFLERFPNAKVLGSAKAKEVLAKPKIVAQFRENDERWCTRLKENGTLAELPAFLEYGTMPIEQIVDDGQTLELGGIPATFLVTPGHSPCSTSVHLPTERALLVSDSVGFYLPENNGFLPMFFQSVGKTLRSIDRVAGIDADVLGYGHSLELLVEGHGQVAAALRRVREKTLELVHNVRGMATRGLTEEAMLETIFHSAYQHLLAKLYLPEYIRGVTPFLLKAILRDEELPAA